MGHYNPIDWVLQNESNKTTESIQISAQLLTESQPIRVCTPPLHAKNPLKTTVSH